LDALRQLQQQQQRSAPLEFDETTRVLGPTVSSAGGGLSETRFTALFEEHCAPLVDRTDQLERRLDAASSEHLAEVEGLEHAVHEFGKKSEFHDRAYGDLGQRLAAISQPNTTSAHLEGLRTGLENLAERTQRHANELMACKMKVASCDDHCALLDDHCVNLLEHANHATRKHDRLLGELLEHRERACLQEQGVQHELHRLTADLRSCAVFSGGDLAAEKHDKLLSELMEHRERVCLQEQGVQQELHRLKADLHRGDGSSDLAGVETRFEKRLQALASNVASQMKLSRDETDQVRLLLAGVQKTWGVTLRNLRPSRRSRHV